MILRFAVRCDLGKGKIGILVPVRVASLEFPFWEKGGGVRGRGGLALLSSFFEKEILCGGFADIKHSLYFSRLCLVVFLT